MDTSTFDRLTRFLASSWSRRVVGGNLIATLLLASRTEPATSHNPLPACRRIKDKKRRAACVRRARQHNRRAHCAGIRCPAAANGRLHCRRGSCSHLTCNAGFGNCDGNQANGCETRLNTIQNCGRCGFVCPNGGNVNNVVSCVNGKCRLTRTFSNPGGPFLFTAPLAGTLQVTAAGGAGADGADGADSGANRGGSGGSGAHGTEVIFAIPVAANEQFHCFVGGAGSPGVGATGGDGGANGGEAGDNGEVSGPAGGGGGGGGGLSEVRRHPGAGGAQIVAASGGGGGGGGGGAQNATNGQTGGFAGNGGPCQNGSLSGGLAGGGGPGGTAASGGDGRAGSTGGTGGGFPVGAVILEGANPGPGRVTLVFDEA